MSSKTHDQINPVNPIEQPSSVGRKLGAVVAGALLAVASLKAGQGIAKAFDNSPKGFQDPTGEYTVQPGDNEWNIGDRVEANHDGVADNEEVRSFVDKVHAEAGKDGEPGVQIGEKLQLPVEADLEQGMDGVQLNPRKGGPEDAAPYVPGIQTDPNQADTRPDVPGVQTSPK